MSVQELSMSITLGMLAWIDWKQKCISRKQLLLFAILNVVGSMTNDISFGYRLAGGIVGLLVLGFSCISGEQLGKGDAFVLSIYGITVGIKSVIALMIGAFFLVCIVGSVLLLSKKVTRTSRVPFLPFLFITQLFLLL